MLHLRLIRFTCLFALNQINVCINELCRLCPTELLLKAEASESATNAVCYEAAVCL